MKKVNEKKVKKIADKVEEISKQIETMMSNRLILAILMIVDGVFTIINPTEQMEINARIIAFTIMLAVIAMLTTNLKSKEKNKRTIIFSIITIVLCIYLLIFPQLLAINLVLLLAIFITCNGLINIFNIIKLNKISLHIQNAENKIKYKLEAGKKDKEFNQEIILEKTERFASPFKDFINKTRDNSVVYLILNIISVILGIVLLINQEITLTLCGVILIYTGLTDLLIVAKTRKLSKKNNNKECYKFKYLKNTYQLIKYNFGTLLKFELLFKILVVLVFMPIVTASFKLSMNITGHSFLMMENLTGFILHPITLLVIVLAIVFLSVITMFDIGTVLIIYDASYHKNKISLTEVLQISLKKCKKLINFKNLGVAFLVLFLIPILDIGVRTNVITAIKIPEFIEDYIVKNSFLSWTILTIYIILTFILAKWIFCMHYMILEEKDFKEARKSSNNISKGHKIRDFIRVVLFEILLTTMYFVIVYSCIELIKLIKIVLANYVIVASGLITIIVLCLVIAFIVFIILSNSIGYAIISTCFYNYKIEKKEKIQELEYSNELKRKRYLIMIVILIALVACSGVISYEYVKGAINFNIMIEQNIEVTAHRGESTYHPENTMSAFEGAKEVNADWIELDVQQTKDKQIVVSHDSNLARVTGVNKDIIDMTYEEISKLDTGSFFDEKFRGEKIPLLEDVLQFAKENNIKLNIELKPVGKEIDFEKQVIELINKYNFENQCVVTSMVYNVLENIKKIDANIQTLYVMTVAIGNITELKYADSFSVEETNANNELIEKVHKEGKKIFVWTVNNEENIDNMIDLGVDNIITDNCPLCKELIEKRKNINIVEELIKAIAK